MQTEAEKSYIDLVNELVKAEQGAIQEQAPTTTTSTFQDITVTMEFGNVCKITLNRPAKYNAITVKVNRVFIFLKKLFKKKKV